MQIVNGTAQLIAARVPGRPPTVMGQTEMVWPPKTILLPPQEITQVTDAEGAKILERFGPAGVVELVAGQTLDDALGVARQARYDFLAHQLNNYKEEQAARKAMGLELRLPRTHHRVMMKELTALEKLVTENDPILQGTFLPKNTAPIQDPLQRELEAMGIPASAGSALPFEAQGLPGLEIL